MGGGICSESLSQSMCVRSGGDVRSGNVERDSRKMYDSENKTEPNGYPETTNTNGGYASQHYRY